MNWFGQILPGAGVDFLDLDDVGVGLELHIVEDAHRRHHKAHLDRERAAQRLDLLGQAVGAVGRVDQRQQRVAEFDLEIVDLQRGRDRLFRRGAGGRRRGAAASAGFAPPWQRGCACAPYSASAAAPPPSARNGSIGMPGSSASTSITPADMPSACG